MRTAQMEAGLRYGVFVSVVMIIAGALGPMGWTLLWTAVSFQLACLAVITWRRTRLPFMTAGASLGVVAGLVMILVGRREYESLLRTDPVPMVAGFLVFPILIYAEKWAHPDVWRRLKARAQDATLRDMLLLRHIPDLRNQ